MICRRCFALPGPDDTTKFIEFVGAYSDRAFELRGSRLSAVRDQKGERDDGVGGDPLRLAAIDASGWRAFALGLNISFLPWEREPIVLPLSSEIDARTFDDLWAEHVRPSLSTYKFHIERDEHAQRLFEEKLGGPGLGPQFYGSYDVYAEYIEGVDMIGGFELYVNGAVCPLSLRPVPTGCESVLEDSAIFMRLEREFDIAPVDRSEYDALWRRRVLPIRRYLRGWADEDYEWRRCDGTIERGPAWVYQTVQGRWIVDEHYIPASSEPGRRRLRETPTHSAWIEFREIDPSEYMVAVAE